MADEVRTRPKDRAASILAAASIRFHRRGYAGTSLDDIAQDLGITAPAIYRHFRGKDALYTAVLETNLRQLEASIAAAPDRDAAIANLARVGVEHPTLGLLWSTDRRRRLVDPDGALQQRLDATADALGMLLDGDIPREVVALLARSVIAAISSTGFYASTLDLDDQVAELSHAVRAVADFHPRDALVTLPAPSDGLRRRPWTTPRATLLDVFATLVITRGGYHAVTIEDTAAAAGMTPGAVYQLFTGKAQLLEEVLRRVAFWVTSALQQAVTQAETADDAFAAAVASALALNERHPSWTGSLADEIAQLPDDRVAEITRLADEYLAEWLALCTAVVGESGEVDEEAVRIRMRAALAVLDDRALEAADRSVFSSADMIALTRAMLVS